MRSKTARTVLDLVNGEEAIIQSFQEESVACKLLTMGIVPDARVKMIRSAPFGGAVCLKLGQTFLAVRNSEAKAIILAD